MDKVPVIVAQGVSFGYHGGGLDLQDVDLTIYAREFVSIVGPNGGGKTTLLRLLLGLLKPRTGTIRIFDGPPEAARARIGYMPQHVRLDPRFPARVIDVVLMGRLDPSRSLGPFRRADKAAAEAALAEVDLLALRNRPFSELSGGQRQRVLIARALAGEPDLLLLDEPTANLDMHVELELYQLLSRLNEKMTVVMVSHDLGFVSQFVQTVVCVKHNVEVHPTSEITGEMIQAIYGGDVRMVRHDHRCAEGGHACLTS